MLTKQKIYWLLQLGGWFSLFSIGLINRELTSELILKVVILAAYAIALSHLLRYVLLSFQLLNKSNTLIIITVLTLSIVFGNLLYGLRYVSLVLIYSENADFRLIDVLNLSFYFLIWQIIYVGYFITEKSRKEELNALQLMALNNEIELRNLRSQLNPHFMFNALNSVRALVDEDSKKAKQAVSLISNILRVVLTSDKKDVVTIKEELELVKDYLAVEKIRFEDRLNVEYNIEEHVLNEKIPPFIIQTLVENAIKHGISNRIQPGKIVVKIQSTKFGIIITIENDISQTKSTVVSTGIGITNLKKRLELLYSNTAQFELIITNEKALATIKLPRYESNNC
jgi:two-component system, LytTR family, sensor kinase